MTTLRLAIAVTLANGLAIPLLGQAIKVTKAKACVSGLVVRAPINVEKEFNPSGWMGDAAEGGKRYLQMSPVTNEKPRPGDDNNLVTKVHYRPGSIGWAGVYWLWPANNWGLGDKPFKQITGASKISFWAAGQKGNEIVEFKGGGVTGKPCQDSFEANLGQVALSKEWKRYEIPLRSHNSLAIVGAFAWVATSDANPSGLTFYLDDIRYE